MDRGGASGGSPLARALVAADAFLLGLSAGDRAGVVAFASDATVLAPLRHPAQARLALAEVTHGDGSRLDVGIHAGVRLLAAAHAGEAKALLLFSDGVSSGEDPGDLPAAVATARGMGIRLYALGFGDPPHGPSLEMVAGSSDRVWLEPSVMGMPGVVETVRADTPCPALLHDRD
jgi:hypothetical protein